MLQNYRLIIVVLLAFCKKRDQDGFQIKFECKIFFTVMDQLLVMNK